MHWKRQPSRENGKNADFGWLETASVLTAETMLIYALPIVMSVICIIAMSFWDINKVLKQEA